jgi:hypothetical protein
MLSNSKFIAPKDKVSQGQILKELKIPEVTNGICLMLSINWALRFLESNPPDGSEAWQSLNNITILKQIARQHQGYLDQKWKLVPEHSSFATLREMVELGSREVRSLADADYYDTDTESFLHVLQSAEPNGAPKASAKLIAFFGHDYGHAIAVGRYGSKCWVFDPNFGVLTTNTDAELRLVVGEICRQYSILEHAGFAFDTGPKG